MHGFGVEPQAGLGGSPASLSPIKKKPEFPGRMRSILRWKRHDRTAAGNRRKEPLTERRRLFSCAGKRKPPGQGGKRCSDGWVVCLDWQGCTAFPFGEGGRAQRGRMRSLPSCTTPVVSGEVIPLQYAQPAVSIADAGIRSETRVFSFLFSVLLCCAWAAATSPRRG